MPDPDRHIPSSYYAGKRALVTGGLGFIGSNLAIALQRLGAEVTIVDSLIPEHGGNFFNIEPVKRQLRVNISDLRDLPSLNVIVQDQDLVFHLAGQVSHGDSMQDPLNDLGINCIATMNLVEACRNKNPTARLVYTSTRQVYGRPLRLPVTEDHPTIPVDVNGINKIAAEYYHLLYHRTYGLRSVVLRLTNTSGPRMQVRTNRQGFIGIMLRQALHGERLRVYGTGLQIRDFNYVDDVVDAILLAGSNDACFGNIYNLGSQDRCNLLEFLGTLHRVVPLSYDVVPFPDAQKMIDIGDYFGDYSSFAAATGWQPRVGLHEGITRTVENLVTHREHYL